MPRRSERLKGRESMGSVGGRSSPGKGSRAPRLDPVESLGPDVIIKIFGLLTPEQLAVCDLVSHQWRAQASSDAVWKPLSEELWLGKKAGPLAVASLPANFGGSLTWKQAYLLSQQLAVRTDISQHELCSVKWKFRFKQTAGEFWLGMDPYWTKQGDSMRRMFLEDGSMAVPAGDPLAWNQRNESYWRFTKTRCGKKGHYVKVNHWPSLLLSRTEDWGWHMQNCWVEYDADLPEGSHDPFGLRPFLDSKRDHASPTAAAPVQLQPAGVPPVGLTRCLDVAPPRVAEQLDRQGV